MKQYLILLAASILFFVFGYLTNDVINEKKIQNIINDKIIRDSLETFFIRDQSCFALFKDCTYFQLKRPDIYANNDAYVLKYYEEAYEKCIKPLRAYRESNHENFRMCYEKDICFWGSINRMEEEILEELNNLNLRIKPKPYPKPKPSFLGGKTQEEIFNMYSDFLSKYDRKNKNHRDELKKWSQDPLFLEVKNSDSYIEKIEALDEMMWAKHKSNQ